MGEVIYAAPSPKVKCSCPLNDDTLDDYEIGSIYQCQCKRYWLCTDIKAGYYSHNRTTLWKKVRWYHFLTQQKIRSL